MAKTVSPLLPALNRILKELGENIRLARLRRRLTATLVAERAGLTRVTLKKVEQGDPGVTLGAYVHVLQSLGLAGDLARLARDDELGRKLQDAGLNVPRKAQKKAILERHSMSNPQKKEIHVYAAWQSLKELTLVGKLFAETHRGKEIFSFEYDQKWLDSKYAQSLDPSLGLFPGRQYPSDEKRNFGIFLDSSPDRWGRTLLERRESQNARIDKRKSRTLLESNFLLGVFDGHRMGALRFKESPSGPFLDDNQENASPPWTLLGDLQNAAQKLEEKHLEGADVSKALRLLLAPGSSLGGARPKSSVVDVQGALWIAKFPSANDRMDVGAWEMVVHELGKSAGIDVPEAKLKKFSGPHHTFLTRRFDRTPKRERLHFASAMTLLGRNDGDNFETGASYLEFVDFITSRGSRPELDLEQLWRRILFFVCTSNIDDHLRNHGFLLEEKGWRLAPAYDINPVPGADGLSLNISESSNAQALDLLFEVAPLFRIKGKAAAQIVREVTSAVRQWRNIASKIGLSRPEQDRMASAFRLSEVS